MKAVSVTVKHLARTGYLLKIILSMIKMITAATSSYRMGWFPLSFTKPLSSGRASPEFRPLT